MSRDLFNEDSIKIRSRPQIWLQPGRKKKKKNAAVASNSPSMMMMMIMMMTMVMMKLQSPLFWAQVIKNSLASNLHNECVLNHMTWWSWLGPTAALEAEPSVLLSVLDTAFMCSAAYLWMYVISLGLIFPPSVLWRAHWFPLSSHPVRDCSASEGESSEGSSVYPPFVPRGASVAWISH